MQYTVNDVLANPLLKNSTLLSANQMTAAKTVESVAVIEMPVEDFVKENDLVLTTAIGCGTNPTLFQSFVQDIYTSGAAALAIATGRHVDCIPEEIIRFANEHHFPLIELPWETRFSDIITTILEQIHMWQQDSLLKTEFIQRELLQLYMDNRSINEALDYLADQFKRNICLLQKGREPLQTPAWSHPIHSFDQIKNDQLEKQTIQMKCGSIIQALPIQTVNQETGLLLLEGDPETSSPLPWSILNQTAAALPLWLQKEQTELTTKNKKMEEFIQLLIKGEWVSKEAAIEQGRKMNIHLDKSYVCLVGHPENMKEYQLKQGSNSSLSNYAWNLHITKKLKETAESAAAKLNRDVFCLYQRDQWIIFLESTSEEASQTANDFLDALDLYIEEQKIPLFSWGIGENHAGVLTFPHSFKNARTALEIGRSHKGPGQRSTYASTGIYRLLTSIAGDSSAIDLMHTTIGAIVSYDRDKGLDLLHTLSVYLYHQGNASQTSRALSLHRQSLLYRLRKIEALTNRILSDPDDLFLLQLCLKLWTVRFESKQT